MKVVHKKEDIHSRAEDWGMAGNYEKEGEYEKAIAVYNRLLKKDPGNPKLYDRLMILYRKLKNPEKEIQAINKAIAVFEKKLGSRLTPSSKKISSLSTALMKATGLSDRKGKNLYVPEPLGRWQKRKALLEKKRLK